jgi:hypothetical protein
VPMSGLPLGTGGLASLADSPSLPPAPIPSGGVPSGGMPTAAHQSTVPQPAGAPARPRDGVRPAEGTIDGWLVNRLFPGR